MTVYTVPELAKEWHVSPDTILGWIRSGKLRAFNVHSFNKRPSWRIPEAALEEFTKLRSNEQPTAKRRRRRVSGPDFFAA